MLTYYHTNILLSVTFATA